MWTSPLCAGGHLNTGRGKRVPVRIGRSHELGGILVLWVYDLGKYYIFGDLMNSRGVDPKIFLCLDMVTVPAFVIGAARLVNSLSGHTLAWPRVTGWASVVLLNTLLPYAYIAAAGMARFDGAAWGVLACLVAVILTNMVRTIRIRILRKKEKILILIYPGAEDRLSKLFTLLRRPICLGLPRYLNSITTRISARWLKWISRRWSP